MRIRIIGGCGSGKTYIAKLLSEKLGIPHYQTDNLVWDRTTNTKFPEEVRDRMLQEIVDKDEWIIEGVHHRWGQSSFLEADYVFIIEPDRIIQNIRTVKRFIKTRLGLEQANYKQTFRDLMTMTFIWNRSFRRDMKDILEITSQVQDNRHIVKNNMDILKILNL